MKISIIIPTYKRPNTLGRAIDSALNQTYGNIEIIVVDDNNKDSEERKITEKFMNKYKNHNNLIYIKHDVNRNGAAARNTGIKKATGEYIMFLDDDDELNINKIKYDVAELEKLSDEYGVIYSGYQMIRNGKIIKKVVPTCYGDLMLDLLQMKWSFGSGSNPLFKREVFKEIGLFDETFFRHQDWEFMVRVFKKYKIACNKKILLNIYADSRINNPKPEKYIEIKKKYLNKFKDDIQKYTLEEQNLIYKNHIIEIAENFLKAKQFKEAKDMYRKANNYSKITFKEKIRIFQVIILTYFPKCYFIIDYLRQIKFNVNNY